MLDRTPLARLPLVVATALVLILAGAVGAHDHGKKDIVDTAVAADDFDTLVTAVKAAGLVDTLKGDGPFTVFAPTDEAFAALPDGVLDALLADKEKLTAVLTYHVAAGKLEAGDVLGMKTIDTVNGQELMVTNDGAPKVGGAGIVTTDIMTSNGVIHVIDTVLVPDGVL